MKKASFLIVGKHAVTEALKNPKRKIHMVFLTEDAKKNLNRRNQPSNLLRNIRHFLKSRKELDNLCGSNEIAHQGLVAEAEPLEDLTLKDFLKLHSRRAYQQLKKSFFSCFFQINRIISTLKSKIIYCILL